MTPPAFPTVVVTAHRHRARHRSALTSVVPLVSVVSSFAIVGLIAYGVSLGPPKPVARPTTTTSFQVAPPKESPRPVPHRGNGEDRQPARQVHHDKPADEQPPAPKAKPRRIDRTAQADTLVIESLRAAKSGLFVRANDLAQDALRLCPDHQAATGAWYLAAYAQQYSDLADEALSRLHGDVDLGSRYGLGAFIERNGDTYTFRCRGGNKKFTVQQLNAINGVRFRITREFLDNAENPANDLILAAIHHLKSIDQSGNQNLTDPLACLDEAITRCQSAGRGDGEVSEHAKHMMALFTWLEARPAAAHVSE